MNLLKCIPYNITKEIINFIDIIDLTKFAIINRISYNLSKDMIQKYKEKEIFEVISFFLQSLKEKN